MVSDLQRSDASNTRKYTYIHIFFNSHFCHSRLSFSLWRFMRTLLFFSHPRGHVHVKISGNSIIVVVTRQSFALTCIFSPFVPYTSRPVDQQYYSIVPVVYAFIYILINSEDSLMCWRSQARFLVWLCEERIKNVERKIFHVEEKIDIPVGSRWYI